MIGLLGLLGERVPSQLKAFVVAMAVVDDLGAILVIAFFYTSTFSIAYLLATLAVLAIAWTYGRCNGQSLMVFLLFGILVWYFMLQSGIHATLAGVLLALVIPARSGMSTEELTHWTSVWLRKHTAEDNPDKPSSKLRQVVDVVESPASHLEEAIRPWILLLIMPLFALFNAGITITGESAFFTTVSVGVVLGLFFGKPLGILAACGLLVALGVGKFSEGIEWRGLIGIGLLAGVGFTMSLFIGQLAFADNAMLDQAKLAVLTASMLAACVGLIWLSLVLPKKS